MRIITGSARGRKLFEPKGKDVRPTTDQVKEAIFNICQFDIEGRRVLDLFGGSGQLGIEAVSRGAREAVIVDLAPESVKLIEKNVSLCGFENSIRVIHADSISFLMSGEKYDIIFMDPPYETDLINKALEIINKFDILKENGIIVCESKLDKQIVELPGRYKRKDHRYGKIKLTVFRRESD